MFGNIFTLDYEIHGNGDGSPYELMVEPTARMLEQFNRYGAKLTIMADVAEIMKFKDYALQNGSDFFHYHEIKEQLQTAVKDGHDVQLHIHPSYFNSRYENGKWFQDWTEYSLADLPYDRMETIVRTCKNFLEELLKPVDPNYKCNVFRSGNWSMVPSPNIIRSLIQNGIDIDTSVFKYGKRTGFVNFDYQNAFSDLIPWPVDEKEITLRDPEGHLIEIPIYCENRRIWSFLTPNRLFRVLQASRHTHPNADRDEKSLNGERENDSKVSKLLSLFTERHALKMDFNQCSGKQLIGFLKRIEKKYGHLQKRLPVVLIGHSKLYTKLNNITLEPFLEFVSRADQKYFFARFNDFDLEYLRKIDAAK